MVDIVLSISQGCESRWCDIGRDDGDGVDDGWT